MKKIIFLLMCYAVQSYALPRGFVYLDAYAPSILQDMRYASYHNFVGRPIDGYSEGRCVLTLPAARQLLKAQAAFLKLGYSLKVYDCYRPMRAVRDFVAWSEAIDQAQMQAEFYPNIEKEVIFRRGYVLRRSAHSRGSTVDVTLVKLPIEKQGLYQQNQMLSACYAPLGQRFFDNSIDMGTGFDCFDSRAYAKSTQVSKRAYQNRMLLRRIMGRYGFRPYYKEWWHFTLRNEPYKRQYFDFPI